MEYSSCRSLIQNPDRHIEEQISSLVSSNSINQSCYATGKTGNLDAHFPRQEKRWESKKKKKKLKLKKNFTQQIWKIWKF